MSYTGYLPGIKGFISQLPADYAPTLLEIGIDTGASLVPLTAFLVRTRERFGIVGVDIKVQEAAKIMLNNLDIPQGGHVQLVQGNSLEVIPKLVEGNSKFDVVLIDGDHNYYTVSRELQHLEALCHPHTLVIIDDYNGRWSERDMWYATREGYEDVTCASSPHDTAKHGVRAAVDEWLDVHPGWKKDCPIGGEPVLLFRSAP